MNRLLGEWGIPKDSPAGRQRLERALEERRGARGDGGGAGGTNHRGGVGAGGGGRKLNSKLGLRGIQ